MRAEIEHKGSQTFPDGTSNTLMFSEKYQVCGSGTAAIENYWFGSYVGNSNARQEQECLVRTGEPEVRAHHLKALVHQGLPEGAGVGH